MTKAVILMKTGETFFTDQSYLTLSTSLLSEEMWLEFSVDKQYRMVQKTDIHTVTQRQTEPKMT